MPIIKSAKKRMKQNAVRRARRFPVRSELKSLIKKELGYVKEGNKEEAVKFLPKVFSVIDTACKKGIIHPNNADRKKSRLAKALNAMTEAVAAEKAPAKKKEEKSEA